MENKEYMSNTLHHIDNFTQICGHFTFETELNGGYGCQHNSSDKEEKGKCYAWDCPLAIVADLEDFKKLDQRLYEEYLGYQKDGIENREWMLTI